ncbi:MAG: ANTAR domain-containing protein [Pseudomonadota bacterium]
MFLTLRAPETARAVLIDRDAGRREMFAGLISDRGFAVAAVYPSAAAAVSARPEADLAIFYAEAVERAESAVEALRAGLDAPLMVLVEDGDPDTVAALMRAGADQVTPVGMRSDRILTGAASAMAARSRIKAVVAERERAEAALETMKLVSRAKGILMTRHSLTEADAHRRVQELSMKRNLPVGETARAIIDAEALLGAH